MLYEGEVFQTCGLTLVVGLTALLDGFQVFIETAAEGLALTICRWLLWLFVLYLEFLVSLCLKTYSSFFLPVQPVPILT